MFTLVYLFLPLFTCVSMCLFMFTFVYHVYLCMFKVVSSEFYFHKPITVHIELYLFYRFIHFLLYIGQY